MKKFLVSLVTVALLSSILLPVTGSVNATSAPNPVALWHFDETDDTTATDSVGLHNGSLLPAGSGPSRVGGMYGQALKFDGDDYMKVPAFDMGSDWTVEGWIQANGSSDSLHCPLFARSGGNCDGLIITYLTANHPWSKEFVADIGDGASWQITLRSAPSTYEYGGWHHLAVTKQGNLYSLYVDGEIKATQTALNVSTSYQLNDIEIGHWNYGTDTYAKALIDEVCIFNTALNAGQIALDAIPSSKIATAYWRLNETAGIIAYDCVDSNDGTLNGSPSWVPGISGNALSLVAQSDYIDAGFTDAFNFNNGSGDFTIDAWIKPQEIPVFASGIVAKATETPFTGWAFAFYGTDAGRPPGSLSFSGVGDWEIVSSQDPIVIGEWTHVAVTKAGKIYTLYKDGVVVNSGEPLGNWGTSTASLKIGRDYPNGSPDIFGLIGVIDEVEICNQALSQSEINRHYQNGLVGLGYYDEGTFVSNVTLSPNPVSVNTPVILTATVSDAGKGSSNIASAEYRIDGGAWIPMTASDGVFDEVTESVNTLIPQFNSADVHTVEVQGIDSAGNIGLNESTFLVVYDPNGGFVTGGGWINSPAGAYSPDPTLVGKANFGFVSKYLKGANIPTGNTEFQFKTGDLNFKSTSYEWLVVAGSKAQFKGVGTINGEGIYKFMLTAVDGSLDTFRIKIWAEDALGVETVVYDNGSQQPIGGGSIVVHTK
jgi:hypothetical protein